jgi:rhodanese-related sulfurtransferase
MKIARYSLQLVGLVSCVLIAACGWGERKLERQAETQNADKVAVINVLGSTPTEYYNDAHITGSIHIPLDKLEEATRGWDKNTHIIVYCANYMCSSSREAVRMLSKLGFKDVRAYEGGMAEWHKKGYPTEGLARQAYLNIVGEKPSSPADVKIIEADELKELMEKAERAGLLVKR